MGGFKEKKRTKQFKAKHLEDTLQKRRQKKMLKSKINKKNEAKKNTSSSGTAKHEGQDQARNSRNVAAKPLAEMDVSEFMENGLQTLLENDSDGETSDFEVGADPFADINPQGQDNDEDDSEDEQDNLPAEPVSEAKSTAAAQHRAELDRLRERDPEFYAYLAKNDGELLDFSGDEEDAEDASMQHDADSDEEERAAMREAGLDGGFEAEEGSDAESDGAGESMTEVKVALTIPMLKKWKASIAQDSPSIKSLRRLVAAFFSCAHVSDPSDESEAQERPGPAALYNVPSSKVYNAVIKAALVDVPATLARLLPTKQRPGKAPLLPSTARNWKKLKSLVKVYVNTSTHLLSQLPDDDTAVYTLHKFKDVVPYAACFPKESRRALKALLATFARPGTGVRILSFMNLRLLGELSPPSFLDVLLKGVYLAFVRNSKFTLASNINNINVMMKCVVELYLLDLSSAYTHAFVYIRQLAVHLRNALALKKKTSIDQVYCWPYVHALRLWTSFLSRVLSTASHKHDERIRPLVYPLVQVSLGAINLLPTVRYLPLRFHIIRALLDLSEHANTFIPLTHPLLAVLQMAEVKKKPKASTAKPLNFAVILKIPKTHVGTKAFHEGILSQFQELAMRYLAIHASSIAFPEMSVSLVAALNQQRKSIKNAALASAVRTIISKIKENADLVKQARNDVDFTPKQEEAVAAWEQALREKRRLPLVKQYEQWKAVEDKKRALLSRDDDRDTDPADSSPRRTAKDRQQAVDDAVDDSDSDDMELPAGESESEEEPEGNGDAGAGASSAPKKRKAPSDGAANGSSKKPRKKKGKDHGQQADESAKAAKQRLDDSDDEDEVTDLNWV